jgi:hypothetical protein
MSLSSSADGGRSGHDSGVLQGDQQRKSYCVVKNGEQGSSQPQKIRKDTFCRRTEATAQVLEALIDGML